MRTTKAMLKTDSRMNWVMELADQLGKLKIEAGRAQKAFQASKRGFFTPTEDDRLAHLKLSYIKVRAALLEVALEAEKDLVKSKTDENGKSKFLIGILAALALADAARFLSANFGKNEVVRRKLNEASAPLEIPAGLYDTVQKSFNDPKRIRSLVMASQLFDRLLKNKGLKKQPKGLVSRIQKLKKSVDLESFGFARERIEELGYQVAEEGVSPIKKRTYEIQESVSRLVSDITLAPRHTPRLPKNVQAELAKLMMPGDVLVTRKEHCLTNYFLPGYWPHAALFLGKMKGRRGLWVLEALKDGVRVRPIDSAFGNDAIVVLRPDLSARDINRAIVRALAHEGKPYDFDFDFRRSDRIVCTGVVYRAYDGVGKIRFALKKRAGRLSVSAEDLLEMALAEDGFAPMVAFSPDEGGQLKRGEAAEQVIRNTLGKKKAPDLSQLF